MTRALSWLAGFTPRFWLGLCLALLAANGVSYCKGRSDGRALERARWEAAVAKAVKKDGEADVAAIETAAAQKAEAQAEVDAGRVAASGSADPWEAAIGAMR